MVFAVFALAYFLSQFFRHANAVISEEVAGDLSLGAARMGLMTSLFYGVFALAQLPLGSALDRFSARWVTPALMSAAVAGALLFGAAHSFGTLAAGRGLLGLGMAGVLMGSYMSFGHWFPARRFATMAGLLVGIGSLGGLGAASPLAWFSESYGWRSVFFLGAAGVVVSAVAILVWGGDPPEARSAASVSAGGLGDVFRSVTFWRIAPLNLFMGGAMLAIQSLWAGPFLFDVAGFSTPQTGRLLTLLSVGAALGYVVCGWLADRVGLVRVLLFSAVVFLLSELAFLAMAVRPVVVVLSAQYLLFGFSGAFQILLLVQVRACFPPSLRGRAVTALNVFGIGGAALLQWAMGLIIGSFTRDAVSQYPPLAYFVAFAFTSVGLVAAVAWYLPLARASRGQVAVETVSPRPAGSA